MEQTQDVKNNKPCALVIDWVKRINSGERADEVIPLTLPMGLTTAQYVECYAFASRVLDGERADICRVKADEYLTKLAIEEKML